MTTWKNYASFGVRIFSESDDGVARSLLLHKPARGHQPTQILDLSFRSFSLARCVLALAFGKSLSIEFTLDLLAAERARRCSVLRNAGMCEESRKEVTQNDINVQLQITPPDSFYSLAFGGSRPGRSMSLTSPAASLR